jgi:predicted Zn-dependent protease
MQPESKIINSFLYILIITSLCGCVTVYNPATQRKEYYFIDTKNEVALGQDMDHQVQQKLKMLNSPLMLIRLNKIGDRLANVSDRRDCHTRRIHLCALQPDGYC